MSLARTRDSILASTRAALAHWASLNRGELPTWPKQSVWDSAITGRATGGRTTIPVQCELVERAVNKLYVTERASRDMILLHYLKGGSAREKVKRLGVSCQNYYARLERAEYAVKIEIGY